MREADLRQANMSEADLADANLDGANLEGAKLAGAKLRGARGGRAASVSVKGQGSLNNDLKVDKPVVFALRSAHALHLRAVKMENQYDDHDTAKGMEVLTGPAAEGPWTSVLRFTSGKTKSDQAFAAVEGAPALAGFVKVVVHDTYGGYASVTSMSLEGDAFGGAGS